MKTKVTRNLFLFLLAFLGLGAIGGGGALIISPSGELMSMPLSLLDKSPFDSYLIPGIILFFVLGLVPLMLIIALLNKPESKLAEQINIFNEFIHNNNKSFLDFKLIFNNKPDSFILNYISFYASKFLLKTLRWIR